jgi:hypothetical protein
MHLPVRESVRFIWHRHSVPVFSPVQEVLCKVGSFDGGHNEHGDVRGADSV